MPDSFVRFFTSTQIFDFYAALPTTALSLRDLKTQRNTQLTSTIIL
jgi:hypothetical protein